MLGCHTHLQVPGLSMRHVRLEHGTPWQAQELGLGVGLVTELWELSCWAAFLPLVNMGARTGAGPGWARLLHLLVLVRIRIGAAVWTSLQHQLWDWLHVMSGWTTVNPGKCKILGQEWACYQNCGHSPAHAAAQEPGLGVNQAGLRGRTL